jgi:hypothetical protein
VTDTATAATSIRDCGFEKEGEEKGTLTKVSFSSPSLASLRDAIHFLASSFKKLYKRGLYKAVAFIPDEALLRC